MITVAPVSVLPPTVALVLGPLGMPELILIMVLALLIFGPRKLPEVGRTIGKGMAEFRKASNDLKRTIQTEIDLDEERVRQEERQRLADASSKTEAAAQGEEEPTASQDAN